MTPALHQKFTQAKKLQDEGKIAEAVAEYRVILEMDEKNLAALHQLAKLSESEGNFVDAIESYRRAIEFDPNPPFWVYRHLGFALTQQEQWEEAIAAYQKAIESNPEDVATYGLLGQAHGRMGDVDGAISSYQKQIELSLDIPVWVYLNLGDGLSQVDRIEEAIEAYEKALALEPENERIQRLLARVVARKEMGAKEPCFQARQLQEAGQLEEALAEYRAVLEVDGSNLVALHQVAQICETQGKWEEAVEGYRRAIEIDAESPFWVYRHLGFVLSKQERLEESVEAYQKALELNPEDGATQSLLGQVLEKTDDIQRRILLNQKAIELNPEQSVGIYLSLGEALTQQKQFEKAIEVYNRAIDLYPEVPGVYEKLGEALEAKGRSYLSDAVNAYVRAIQYNPNDPELCHKALEIQPRNASLYTKLAGALVRHDQFDEAIVFFRMGLEVDPSIAEIASELYLEFGNAWAKHGKFLDAIRVYREGLERDPGNDLLAWQIQNTQAMHDRELAYPIEMVEHIRLRKPEPLSLPTSNTPVISIIIPVYNQILHTYNCLRSLAVTLDGTLPFEVIVMDDHSSDNTQEVLAQIQGVQSVFNEQNLGFIGSCNRGASLAKGEYLFFLNNDTVVLPNCIQELLETFKQVPNAGLVGSKLLYPNGKLQEAGGIIWQDGSAWNYGRLDHPNKPEYCYLREVDYCSGAGIMIPAWLWNQIGGFDTRYKPAYCEDSDLAFEVKKAGYKVLCQPLAKIVHFEGISSGTDLTKGVKKYQVINQQKLIEKWKSVLQNYRQNGVDPHWERERNIQKRILVVDACTPEPDRDAGSVTAFNNIKIFQELGYKVSFAANNLLYVNRYTEDLQRIGVECLYASYVTSIVSHLQNYGNQYDFIFLTRAEVGERYIDDVRRLCPNSKVIYDTVDLHYLREQREAEIKNSYTLAQKAEETKRKELDIIHKSDCTIVLSEVEQKILLKEQPDSYIDVFPIPREIYGLNRDFDRREGILFIGGFRHNPNVDAMFYFIQEVFPLIQKKIPDIKVFIIGSDPPPELSALASKSIIFTGYVADISEYFDVCKLSIAPLRYGAGIKGKILTSFCYGVPVVATSLAAEGMGLTDGYDVLIGDTPESFAQQVIAVYSEQSTWKLLSEKGLELVSSNYSMEAVKQKFQSLFNKLNEKVEG